jgi:hypothetical protein
MSTTKISNDAIGLAALTGAGLYAGSRVLHNALNALDPKPKEQHGVTSDKIVIKLPKKKEDEEKEKVANDVYTIPAMVAALAGGFYGSSKLHNTYKKHVAEKELAETHKKYNELLAKLQTEKQASDTPIIDAMCEEICKVAFLDELGNIGGNIMRGNIMPWQLADGKGYTDENAHYTTGKDVSYPIISATADNTKDKLWDTVGKPLLGIGGTVAAIKFLADRTKRKREEEMMAKMKAPTQIVIDQT